MAINYDLRTVKSSVAYGEWIDGYREDIGVEQSSATRRCSVAWADAGNFQYDMLGSVTKSGPGLFRTLPESHPRYPGLIAVKCGQVNTEGTPDQSALYNDLITFERLVYDVQYQSVKYARRGNGDVVSPSCPELSRYVERNRNYQFENLVVPPGNTGYKYFGGTTPVQEGIPVPAPTEEWTYTWHRIPEVPLANINALRNKVNDDYFDHEAPEGYLAEPGTLLFLGVEQEWYERHTGDIEYTLRYKFAYRQNGENANAALGPTVGNDRFRGWNWFYRATAGVNDWVFVSDDGTGTGTPVFASGDFNTLFQMV